MKNSLKFDNKKFRVMLVGDPHESYKNSTEKEKAVIKDYLNLQYAAVKELKPDLVILMGDNASGRNEEELRDVLLRITAPYAENDIPFAFVLGNHDLEKEVKDLFVQYNIYRSLPCCILPDKDEINEYGDYNIAVKNSENSDTILNFWLMYSGSGAPKEYFSTYGFVKKEQIKWYENKAKEIQGQRLKPVPSMVFQHIPVPEEFKLLKEHSFLKMLTDGVTGQNEQKGRFYALDKTKAAGYMGEAPCTSGYNSGQFSSWKKTGDVMAAFFGHDHMNDFAGDVDGITLGQCKTAGFNVYGDGLMQGVRIIDFNENNVRGFSTRMVYYRELIGSDCYSVSGSEKILRDRTSVKLDVIKAALKYTALPIALGAVTAIIRNRRK